MSLTLSSPPANKMTGILIKNEKFALPTREKPKNSAALIVMPERETPGISAKA